MPAGTLYVVATPIGNLEDITLRALRVLRESSLIAAEDTRVTRKLLTHFDIHVPCTSWHQHSRDDKTESLIGRLLAGHNIALVSDAGMPGISDPGVELVVQAARAGIAVVPIPGPNAALSALIVSGLPAGRFVFEGFPPRTRTDRREFFATLRAECRTILLYESPGRLRCTLEDLYRMLGDRPVAVARELTKLYEEVFRGTLAGAIEHFESTKPRGEFTLVIGGASRIDEGEPADPDTVRRALLAELSAGATPRDSVRAVAVRMNVSRRLVYHLLRDMDS